MYPSRIRAPIAWPCFAPDSMRCVPPFWQASNTRIEMQTFKDQFGSQLDATSPQLRDLIEGELLPALRGPLSDLRWLQVMWPAGAAWAAYRLICGQHDIAICYGTLRERVMREGPRCVPYAVGRVDGARVISLFVAWTLTGTLLYVFLFALLGFLAMGVASSEWQYTPRLRSLVQTVLLTLLTDILILRAWLMPLLATVRLGFAQYAVQLYYLQIGLIKGLSRLIIYLVLFIDSFFFPHRCAFQAGREGLDASHRCFVALVLWQVQHERESIKLTSSVVMHAIAHRKVRKGHARVRRGIVGPLRLPSRRGCDMAQQSVRAAADARFENRPPSPTATLSA